MEKFILLMWLCTATTPMNCQQIKTDRVQFTDQYSCTVYGYSHSLRIIRDFGKEQINQYNLFTKFLCTSKKNTKKKETNA